ncbi:MAG: UvrD-helicase domain-containing protein [Candidatus Brocadiaceae bacterium]|nr:UvrD-helicase domain-containing protein [Candidatus Brocadiaceae bacterium]
MPKPIDNEIREIAVSEQERNIVVTAGAGTGKTTLLVHRILHLLLAHKRFQEEESPILKIVAMTFTEKAAGDMKIRLMEELERIVSVINGNASGEMQKKVEGFLSHLRDEYQITYREIERRAQKSMEDFDKALIGTIHSFAAYILRLYPIESGVNPGFMVDKGDIFDELFEKEWSAWLEKELVLTSPNAAAWKSVFWRSDLESIKELARQLSGFTIPLDFFPVNTDTDHYLQPLLSPLQNKIRKIIPLCEKQNNNLLLQLQKLTSVFHEVQTQGAGFLHSMKYDPDKNASTAKVGWTDNEFEYAQKLVKESHSLIKKLKAVDEEYVTVTMGLIFPFLIAFRKKYLSQGAVSFDGLLTLTRDLLKNSEYRYIRERLKNEFRAILVDEFQDTDPIQYDIVLYLCEALGHYSKDARNVILEPGKLFIVGDPKQSIYAFRRADIEAYESVVKQVCGKEKTLKLQENFRSHSGIVEVVNQLFDGRIMVEQPGLQPGYIPIHAHRQKTHSSQKVEMIFVSDKEGAELRAGKARNAEAVWIAKWIAKQGNRETLEDISTATGFRKLLYRDIALLLRSFTQVRPYVEAFKAYGIPYLVEGEKYFYTNQEIIDFMNLLRIIENPYDTIALTGVLRSPIVGLTDREIYELRRNQLLDYRKDVPKKLDFDRVLNLFYAFLMNMNLRAQVIPVSDLIAEIIDKSQFAEITARTSHGEQKLANLRKLHQMACEMEHRHGISLKTFVDNITLRMKEARDEGESPLSDETLNVVKILTVHKSKGLEFPVVILGNLHGEARTNHEMQDSALFDWSTATTGIIIGKGNQHIRNIQSIAIEKKLSERSREEEKRILYVAMTRAKERLILTGSFRNDGNSSMGLITKAVEETTGLLPADEATKKFFLGNAEVTIEHFKNEGKLPRSIRQEMKPWNVDWKAFIDRWEKRKDVMAKEATFPLFVSPTAFSQENALPIKFTYHHETTEQTEKNEEESRSEHAATVGSICHRVLEKWDFHGSHDELQKAVEIATIGEHTTKKFKGDAKIHYQEAFTILSNFIGSEAYKELQNAQILGREIPVLLRWNEQIMRGSIDVLYKTGNNIIIADYKTGHIHRADNNVLANKIRHGEEGGASHSGMDVFPKNTAKYIQQKEIYTEAIRRGLGIKNPQFKIIFLRTGTVITI